MTPSRRAIEQLLRSWGLPREWGEASHHQLGRVVRKISLANGGRIQQDVPLSQGAYDWFFVYTVATAVARAMRLRAEQLGEVPTIPYRMVPAGRPRSPFAFVETRRPAPRVDVNRATVGTLAKLEGLDSDSARKIIAHRRAHGPFSDLSSLGELVGEDALRRLQHHVFVGNGADQTGLSLRERRFRRDPSFRNHIAVLVERGVIAEEDQDFELKAVNELEEIAARLRAERHPSGSPGRVTPASEILWRRRIDGWARRRRRRACRDVVGAALLDGSQYPRFVIAALAEARETVRVVMFYIAQATGGRRRHPIDSLLAELVNAVHRGVDVRVIIDKDEEGDVFNSRRINRDAFRFLVAHGIPVVFTSVNRVIHSKVVVIDHRHVIAGSHNWTAGSFFHYDDKSLYIDSEELAESVERRFNRLWRQGSSWVPVRDRILPELQPELARLQSRELVTVEDFLEASATDEQRVSLSRVAEVPLQKIERGRAKLLYLDLMERLEPLRRSIPKRITALEQAKDRLGS